MKFTIHDAKGRIVRTGYCPDGMETIQAKEKDGEGMVQGEGDHARHYVDKGVITNRPANPATLAGLVLSNLPSGAKVSINGKSYVVTDSSIELEFTYPGNYRIVVEAFPYLDAVFEVTK